MPPGSDSRSPTTGSGACEPWKPRFESTMRWRLRTGLQVTKRYDRGSTTYLDPGCQVSSFTDVCRLERVQMFSIRITLYGNGPYGKTGGQAADMTRYE